MEARVLEVEDTDMDYVMKDIIFCQTETKPVIPSQKKHCEISYQHSCMLHLY